MTDRMTADVAALIERLREAEEDFTADNYSGCAALCNRAAAALAAQQDELTRAREDAGRYRWFRELLSEEMLEFINDIETREEADTYPDASAGYTPTARRHPSVYVDEAIDARLAQEKPQ